MALRGVLLDLEGVLYQDGRPIDGAIGAMAALRELRPTVAPRR